MQALKSRYLCFWAETYRENKGKWKRFWVFVKSPGQHAEKQAKRKGQNRPLIFLHVLCRGGPAPVHLFAMGAFLQPATTKLLVKSITQWKFNWDQSSYYISFLTTLKHLHRWSTAVPGHKGRKFTWTYPTLFASTKLWTPKLCCWKRVVAKLGLMMQKVCKR